jgi:hypothetical protein
MHLYVGKILFLQKVGVTLHVRVHEVPCDAYDPWWAP